MEQTKNKIQLNIEDSQNFLDSLQTIYILKKHLINSLEYTGEYNAIDQETCLMYINSLNDILMKKII